MWKLFRTKSIESALAQTHAEGHSLKRNLGVWDMAMMAWLYPWAQVFSRWGAGYRVPCGSGSYCEFPPYRRSCLRGCGVLLRGVRIDGSGLLVSAYTFTYTTLGEFIAGLSAGILFSNCLWLPRLFPNTGASISANSSALLFPCGNAVARIRALYH